METSSFPEAVEQQDTGEAVMGDDTETGVDWTTAGLDARDEEAPLSLSAISPSSRVTDDTGVDKADDTGTGDVETGSTDGIGVGTLVTGETEAGAVAEGTDETGTVDEVKAVGDTEGSTDMERGVLEDTQEQVHWNWRSPRPAYSSGPRDLAACSAGTGPKKDRPEADDRTHDKQNR